MSGPQPPGPHDAERMVQPVTAYNGLSVRQRRHHVPRVPVASRPLPSPGPMAASSSRHSMLRAQRVDLQRTLPSPVRQRHIGMPGRNASLRRFFLSLSGTTQSGACCRFVGRLPSPIGFRDRPVGRPVERSQPDVRHRRIGQCPEVFRLVDQADIRPSPKAAMATGWRPQGAAVDRAAFRVATCNVRGRGPRIDSVLPPGGPSLPVREDSWRGRAVDRRTSYGAVSLNCRR